MPIFLKKLKIFLKIISSDLAVKVYIKYPRRFPKAAPRVYQWADNRLGLKNEDKILDIGSGAYPLPFATILADKYLETTNHRHDPLVRDYKKPFLICDVENLPFKTKAIDFVHCSHLLEHVNNPINACKEIARIGKRGFIETPTFTEDVLFAYGRGMHKWFVVAIEQKIIFFEYTERQLDRVRNKAWQQLIQSNEHNELQELYYKNPEIFTTQLLWNNVFTCIVFKLDGDMEIEVCGRTNS